MIIDTFLYYNEFELLELRLKVLYDYVDKFVIVEGDHTHKGDPTPFRCREDLKKLGFENDPKIHLIEMNLKSYEEEPDPWIRSNPARNAQASICEDDDIVIIADLDELYHPHMLQYHTRYLDNNPDVLLINRCYDLQASVEWTLCFNNNPWICNAPIMAKGSFWKNHTPAECRRVIGQGGNSANIPFNFTFLNDVELGWHLTWMGNTKRKLSKINTSCHWRDKVNDGERLDSSYTADKITEFVPTHNGPDILSRPGCSLQRFDYSNLFEIIGDLPHLKDFLLGKDI